MNKTIYTVFLVLVIVLVSASFFKAWYWPPASYDAVAGYDLYGKLIADGVNPYGFKEIHESAGNRGKIPPLIPVGLAVFHSSYQNSQVLMSLILIATCLLFYFNIKNKTHALAGIFLMLMTPEFIAFSSIVNTNTAVALFIFAGVIFLDKQVWLSVVMFSLAVLTRSDAIIFVGIAFLFTDRRMLIAVIPFVLWQVYLYLVGLPPTSMLAFPSYEKLNILLPKILEYMFYPQLFGITFIAFIGVLLMKRHNEKNLRLAILIVVFFLGNVFLYLCLDPIGMGSSYEHIINASFKRSLFVFVPLCWWYVWMKS